MKVIGDWSCQNSKTTQLNDALQWRQILSVNNYLNFFHKAIILLKKIYGLFFFLMMFLIFIFF